MRRLARANFRQMQAMQRVRQHRIIGGKQNEIPGLSRQHFGQSAAARAIARADDHQRATRQGARRRNRIGQPLVIRHKTEQTCVEAGGGSC